MKNKAFLFLIFLVIAFIFSLFCFAAYFGGFSMASGIEKCVVFIFLCIVVIVPMAYFIFFNDGDYKYRNIQEISDSGITLIYKGKNEKSKICFVKYYDNSDFRDLVKNLKKGDIIYIEKDATIDKEVFDSINASGVDYSIRFPETSAKIEINGN